VECYHHISGSWWRNTPVEVMERRTGMFMEGFGNWCRTVGCGTSAGGLGGDVRSALCRTANSHGHQKVPDPALGVAGATTGPDLHVAFPGYGKLRSEGHCIAPMLWRVTGYLPDGGGGGYGLPEAREPELVLEDVWKDYVTVDSARATYKGCNQQLVDSMSSRPTRCVTAKSG